MRLITYKILYCPSLACLLSSITLLQQLRLIHSFFSSHQPDARSFSFFSLTDYRTFSIIAPKLWDELPSNIRLFSGSFFKLYWKIHLNSILFSLSSPSKKNNLFYFRCFSVSFFFFTSTINDRFGLRPSINNSSDIRKWDDNTVKKKNIYS